MLNASIGTRYALVFYGTLSMHMAKTVIDRGCHITIAILDRGGTPSPPEVFEDSGVVSFGYLDVLGVSSSLLNWVEEKHPEWILYTAEGEAARYWYGQNVMCNMAIESFRDYLVNEARYIVNAGYEGVFLDDVVMDPSTLGGPLYDRPMYDESEYGPWIDHLVELFREIRNETGAVVMYNAGWSPPNKQLMDVGDGVMLESHPGSWSGNVNSPNYYFRNWDRIYNISVIAQEYAEKGKMVVALNYGGDEKTEFYTYAAVRLFDFYYWYSTPALDSIPEAKVLKLDLGKPLSEHEKAGDAYYRTYSKGMTMLNPTDRDSRVSLKVPQNVTRVTDMRTGKVHQVNDCNLTLDVGPQEGVVLFYGEVATGNNSDVLLLAGLVIAIAFFLIVVFMGRRGVLRRVFPCRAYKLSGDEQDYWKGSLSSLSCVEKRQPNEMWNS